MTRLVASVLSLRTIARTFPDVAHRLAHRAIGSKTGKVKFYLRDKGYGFITADGAGDGDIFLHRTAFVTHVPPEHLRHPFAREHERVSFDTQVDASSGQTRAVNVTWINGEPIPPLRQNFLGTAWERVHRDLGEAVYRILSNKVSENALSEAEQNEKIRDAYAFQQTKIDEAHQLIVNLGMDVADFPVYRSENNGRVLFKHVRDEDVITPDRVILEGATEEKEPNIVPDQVSFGDAADSDEPDNNVADQVSFGDAADSDEPDNNVADQVSSGDAADNDEPGIVADAVENETGDVEVK
jgi:cold shock CspA family protein